MTFLHLEQVFVILHNNYGEKHCDIYKYLLVGANLCVRLVSRQYGRLNLPARHAPSLSITTENVSVLISGISGSISVPV